MNNDIGHFSYALFVQYIFFGEVPIKIICPYYWVIHIIG